EALAELGVGGDVVVHDLDDDLPLEVVLVGQVHLAHAPFAQEGLGLVPAHEEPALLHNSSHLGCEGRSDEWIRFHPGHRCRHASQGPVVPEYQLSSDRRSRQSGNAPVPSFGPAPSALSAVTPSLGRATPHRGPTFAAIRFPQAAGRRRSAPDSPTNRPPAGRGCRGPGTDRAGPRRTVYASLAFFAPNAR